MLKYLILIAVWCLIFHGLGLKNFLLDYSLKNLPLIKAKPSLWMKLLSEAGDKLGQSASVVLSLHYLKRDQALTMVVALAMGTALNSLLKNFWHEPRPYLLSEHIIPAKCKATEYGLPSGHTMGFMLVYRTFTLMYETRY